MSAPTPLSAGQLLGDDGRYVIVRPLASGAFGAVYEARARSGRGVAVKTLTSPRALKRFEREAKLLRRVRHPHLVRCLAYGYDTPTGLYFLVMPLLHGQTLAERLRTGPPMSLPDVVRVLGCVAGALDALHRLGLVHRDVKPSNVMMSLRLRPLRLDATLIDLGLALVPGEEPLTQAQCVVGTPPYMAPEQIAGAQVDGRADLYALATVAFEMLTGRPPFTGQNPTEVMAQHLDASLPDARALRPDLPMEAQQCLEQALSKDPSHRPQRAKAWVRALGDALACDPSMTSETPSTPNPKTSSQTPSRRRGRRQPPPSHKKPNSPTPKPTTLASPTRKDVLWRVALGVALGVAVLWGLLWLRR